MASRLRKAINTIKDQTSVSLALVALRGSSTSLEVAVLKATSHDEAPVADRWATEVVLLASSSSFAAGAAASALQRRISKTTSWVVALKTLTIIYTTIVDSSPDFRREAAMRRLLDLSSFRSSPWDFTAFVRTYALYLDARLQASLQGYISLRRRRRRPTDLQPAIMLDRIQHWQQLLDRAIGTRPTGPAKTNQLVQISLSTVVCESFDLYRDVAGGMSFLLDRFFELPYPSCVMTVEACRKTAKLFKDLEEFYELCKNIGVVGKEQEYPTIEKISKKLLERLNQYLRDHQDSANLMSTTPNSPQKLLIGPGPSTESMKDMVAMQRRGASFHEGKKPDTGNSSPSSSMRRFISSSHSMPRTTTNPFLGEEAEDEEEKPLALVRAATGREEGENTGRKSFENSAWIQNNLGETARQQLIQEQQQWLKHQNRIVERNLALP